MRLLAALAWSGLMLCCNFGWAETVDLKALLVACERAVESDLAARLDEENQTDTTLDATDAWLVPIQENCPNLVAALAENSLTHRLVRADPDQWTLSDANGIIRLLDQKPEKDPRYIERMDHAALAEIMANLPNDIEENPSWFDRFWRWLAGYLRDNEVEVPAWWQELEVPAEFFEWMLYISMGVLVILALVIIANEIRHARAGRSRATSSLAGGSNVFSKAGEPSLWNTLEDVDHRHKPGVVLQLLVQDLRLAGLLRAPPGITSSSIADHAKHLPAASLIAEIAHQAEGATYGQWRPSKTDLEQIIGSARDVLEANLPDHEFVKTDA